MTRSSVGNSTHGSDNDTEFGVFVTEITPKLKEESIVNIRFASESDRTNNPVRHGVWNEEGGGAARAAWLWLGGQRTRNCKRAIGSLSL